MVRRQIKKNHFAVSSGRGGSSVSSPASSGGGGGEATGLIMGINDVAWCGDVIVAEGGTPYWRCTIPELYPIYPGYAYI